MTVKRITDSVMQGTYEFLGLASVFNRNIGLSSLVQHLEGEMLDIGLHFNIVELATNETLGIEDTENGRSAVEMIKSGNESTCCEGSWLPGSLRHHR